MKKVKPAAISLGGNMGDRAAMIRAAVARIAAAPGVRLLDVSPLYETEPVDVPAEFASCSYINAAALFETDLSPEAVADLCHGTEDALGRIRTGYHHPRTIDVDLLFVGDERRDAPHLRLPHPQISSRRFVCRPLADICPDFTPPGFGCTIAEALARLPEVPRVKRTLLLASASPRRARLLAEAGIFAEIAPTHAEERDVDGDSSATARANALAKFRAARAAHPCDWVLAADTAIGFRGRVFGKPADRAGAIAMLHGFSGATQTVHSSVAFAPPHVETPVAFTEEARVTFRRFTEAEAAAYIDEFGTLDRAGAYDVSEHGDRVVAGFEGFRSTIEGLPVETLLDRLSAAGFFK